MKCFLRFIEVDNFKTFKDRQRIGPLKQICCLFGGHGAGKSNLIDAIHFVMGANSAMLRVPSFDHLCYETNDPGTVRRQCSVRAEFQLSNSNRIFFQRIVIGSEVGYNVNDQVCVRFDYMAELSKYGINLIENKEIINDDLWDGYQLSKLLDSISVTDELRQEYERLKDEMSIVAEDFNFAKSLKIRATKQLKVADKEIKILQNYNDAKHEFVQKYIPYLLYQLFYLDQDILDYLMELPYGIDEDAVSMAEEYRKIAELELDNIEAECKRFAVAENRLDKQKIELFKKEHQIIQTQDAINGLIDFLVMANEKLTKAKSDQTDFNCRLQQLDDDLQFVEQLREKFVNDIANRNRFPAYQLLTDQLLNFDRLKKKYSANVAELQLQLKLINSEQQIDKDELLFAMRRKQASESDLNCMKMKRMEMDKGRALMVRQLSEAEGDYDKLMVIRTEMLAKYDFHEKRQMELDDELNEIQQKIIASKWLKVNSEIQLKKAAIFNQIKEEHTGIFDKIRNICRPIDERYQRAFYIVTVDYEDAIVIETTDTVDKCIPIYRTNGVGQIFLPLDNLQIRADEFTVVQGHVSRLEVRKPKMLYDLVQYDDPTMELAIRYITQNAVVCETREDAFRFAYETQTDQHYNAVSLDGVYFQKGGKISGGRPCPTPESLTDSEIDHLVHTETEIYHKIKQSVMKSMEFGRLDLIEVELDASKSMINFIKKKLAASPPFRQDDKIKEFEECLQSVQGIINQKMDQVKQRDLQIKQLRQQVSEHKDFLTHFCEGLNVPNVNVNDERNKELLLEQSIRIKSFDQEIFMLKTKRDVKRSEKPLHLEIITKWEKSITEKTETKRRLEENLTLQQLEIVDLNKTIEELTNLLSTFNHAEMEQRLCNHRDYIHTLNKQIISNKLDSHTKLVNVQKKIDERESILKKCTEDDIPLPVIQETELTSLEDIPLRFRDHLSNSIDYSNLPDQYQSVSTEDYARVCKELRNEYRGEEEAWKRLPEPDLQAPYALKQARKDVTETKKNYRQLSEKHFATIRKFEEMKKNRCDEYYGFFNHICANIDAQYKLISDSQFAQASLMAEDDEEPYLDEIIYHCVAPGQRFAVTTFLDDDQKRLATLALYFTIRQAKGVPIITFDPFDGLSEDSINKFIMFINKQTDDVQLIFVSKDDFLFGQADTTLCIYLEEDPITGATHSVIQNIDLDA